MLVFPIATSSAQVQAVPPDLSKAFSPDSIVQGEVSTLTFTIDNTISDLAPTNVAFTDNLPAGVTVATPSNASTTCTGGSLTAAGGTISYSGGSVAVRAACTISVDVAGETPGTKVNVSSTLTSSEFPDDPGGPATDELVVTAAMGTSFNDAFASFPTQVGGSYVPLPGDFDCDGIAREILWYGPGALPDSFWKVTGLGPGVTKVAAPLAVNGTYTPFTGDWDNDDCDDIFWYAPGPAKDYVWYFDGPGVAFESVQVNVSGTYVPTAIAPAPGVGGVFWYAPGAGQEYIWLGGPARGQFSSALGPTINGTDYRPVRLGDFDGGVPGDTMLFHRPGPGTDYVLDKVLFGNTAPISTPVDIPGTHIPLGVFGDNPAAIMYGPGAAPDLLFGPLSAPPPLFGTVAPGTVNGVYTPAVSLSGDLIVWHAPGAATDYLWIGVS